MTDRSYRSIESAHRDGRAIIVGEPETGEYIMRWREDLGAWWAVDGSLMWSEGGGCGPTYWRNLDS